MRPGCAGAPFILLGLAILLAGRHSFLKGRETLDWPSVPGKILTASSVEYRPSGGSAKSRTTGYYPYWTYEYTVDGLLYTSNRIREGEGSRGYNKAADAERGKISLSGRHRGDRLLRSRQPRRGSPLPRSLERWPDVAVLRRRSLHRGRHWHHARPAPVRGFVAAWGEPLEA